MRTPFVPASIVVDVRVRDGRLLRNDRRRIAPLWAPVVVLALNFGCQSGISDAKKIPADLVPETVTVVVLVAEDAGPTLRISPSAIRNELGRIAAERQRREAMATVLPSLRLLLSSTFLSEQMRSGVAALAPGRLPFRIRAALETDLEPASGGDRLYLTVSALGLATGAHAETPLRAFVEVRVQLRLEDGTLAWDDTVRVDERVKVERERGQNFGLDVTARNGAADLLNLKAEPARALFSSLSRDAVAEAAARLNRATTMGRGSN